MRVVIDRNAETPPHARILNDAAKTLIVTAGPRNPRWPAHVETVALGNSEGRIDLEALMRELAARELNEVHVEAGAGLNGALLRACLVDELLLYVAPCLIGDPARGIAEFTGGLSSLDARVSLEITELARLGADLRILAIVKTTGG